MEEQVNVDDFQEEANEEIQKNKILEIGKKKFSFKAWLGGIIAFLIAKFMTDPIWQRWLFVYLLVVCPIGSYYLIKFIIKCFLSMYIK